MTEFFCPDIFSDGVKLQVNISGRLMILGFTSTRLFLSWTPLTLVTRFIVTEIVLVMVSVTIQLEFIPLFRLNT